MSSVSHFPSFNDTGSSPAMPSSPAASAAAAAAADLNPHPQLLAPYEVEGQPFDDAEAALDYALYIIRHQNKQLRGSYRAAAVKSTQATTIFKQLQIVKKNEEALRGWSATLMGEKEELEQKLTEMKKQRNAYHQDNAVLVSAFGILDEQNTKLGLENDCLKAASLRKIGEKGLSFKRASASPGVKE